MFADDPKMNVTQEPGGGKIRMSESDVPRDFLNVRIHHVSFADTGSLPINNAHPSNVRRLGLSGSAGLQEVGKPGSTFRVAFSSILSSPDAPRISGELYDVTVSEALDYILGTYSGFWIYAVCPGETGRPAAVRVNFVQTYPLSSLPTSVR
jgi:hypothetical protein